MYAGSNPVLTSQQHIDVVGAIGAAVARFPDTEEVAGSIPVPPTTFKNFFKLILKPFTLLVSENSLVSFWLRSGCCESRALLCHLPTGKIIVPSLYLIIYKGDLACRLRLTWLATHQIIDPSCTVYEPRPSSWWRLITSGLGE